MTGIMRGYRKPSEACVMALYHKKIPVAQLEEGMYVAHLDRPWVETPYPIQGFFIESPDDIRELEKYCDYVIIDIFRGIKPTEPPNPSLTPVTPVAGSRLKSVNGNGATGDTRGPQVRIKVTPLKVMRGVYHQKTTLRREIGKAANLHKGFSDCVGDFYKNLRTGRPLNLATTCQMISQITDSIIRNPDALLWVSRLEQEQSSIYSHSLRTAIWALVFARHLGLSRESMQHLTLGIVLSEIGMLRLPAELVSKQRLTPRESEYLKRHVELGVELATRIPGLDRQVLSIIACKNERHDGSGYPKGITGDRIPYLSKIAGIADYYDELTNLRHHRTGKERFSAADAIAEIYQTRGIMFQDDLVDEFIQAIGVYPPGSLVELNTGEVGIITSQNRDKRLQPEVLLLLGRDKRPLKKRRTIDLYRLNRGGKKKPVVIEHSLVDGAYRLDLRKIYEKTFNRGIAFRLAS